MFNNEKLYSECQRLLSNILLYSNMKLDNHGSYINKKFGNLLVVSVLEQKIRNGISIKCICDCGQVINVERAKVLSGHTKSCGCLKTKPRNHGFNSSVWKGFGEISLTHFNNIKRSAIDRNIEFIVDIEYLWNLFLKQNKKCALSDLEITFKADKNRKTTASLDRIDNSKGYVEENIQWVHKDINFMKHKLDQNYFIEICKKISLKFGEIK